MKTPRVLEVDGFLLPPACDAKQFRAVQKYVPEKGRIIMAAYPKCGTTWIQQMVLLILRKGVPPADADEYFSLINFMEMTTMDALLNLREDASIKTHLPFDKIIFSKDVKYIHVARHPADCVVSYYHHCRYFPEYLYSDGTFDDFFETFMCGRIDYGDYFDHLLSWYGHKNEPNMLLITFESAKADKKGTILKIAKFLGDEFYEDLVRDDERVLTKVLQYSSIEYMKETVNKYWDEVCSYQPKETEKPKSALVDYSKLLAAAKEKGHFSVGNFIRKGSIGDGKMNLSKEQMTRLETRMQEKFSHTDVMDLWKKN